MIAAHFQSFSVCTSLSGLKLLLFSIFLFTPAILHSSFADAPLSSKTFFFLALVLLAASFCVINLLATKKPPVIKLGKLDVCLILLVTFIIANSINQVYQTVSLRLYDLTGLCLLYALLRCLSVKDYILLLIAVLFSGVIEAIHGIGQIYGLMPFVLPRPQVIGSFYNAGPYAGFLATIVCIAFGLHRYLAQLAAVQYGLPGRKSIGFISFWGMAAIIIVLAAARSRAAWLATVSGCAVVLYDIYKPVVPKLRLALNKVILRYAAVCLTVLVIGVGTWALYNFKKESADGRLLIWKVSTAMIRTNPVTGVGFDRFNVSYMNEQSAYFKNIRPNNEVLRADNTCYAFNELLQLTVENGFAGLILIAITAIVCFTTKVNPDFAFLKTISISIIVSVYAFGMFSYPMQILPLKLILVLALALVATLDKEKLSSPVSLTAGKSAMAKIALLVLSGSLLWVGASKVTTAALAFMNWQHALSLYDNQAYNESIRFFRTAYPDLRRNGNFLMHYGKALTLANDFREAQEVLQRARHYLDNTVIETSLGDTYKALKRYPEAEKAYQKAADMVPGLFYPEYLLAKLYEETGERSKAVNKATALLSKEVKVPSEAIKEIQAQMTEIINRQSNQ